MSTNKMILRSLRGDILQFIYESKIRRVKESAIQTAFFQYYCYPDIDRAISYLVDRGFLDEELVQSPINIKRCEEFYSLSADGMLIVEGSLSDKGITIDLED